MTTAGQQATPRAGEPTAAAGTMRAVVQDTYGQEAADVLRLEEIDRPEVEVSDAIGYLHVGRARGKVVITAWGAQTPHQHPDRRIFRGQHEAATSQACAARRAPSTTHRSRQE